MKHEKFTLLDTLLMPMAVSSFQEVYWQRKDLLIKRGDPRHYANIITLDDIDRVLSEVAIPRENIDMGQNAIGIPKEAYANSRFVRPEAVLQLHQRGETIIFRGAHNWFPRLSALCNELSAHFHCKVQTNLYLTPAGTQSSYPHWDAHDIFVLQVEGSKTWKLHEDRLRMPLPRYEFAPGRYEVGPERGEMVLSAGDFAYVPRGLIHNPVADAYSVHVAVGLIVVTWVDVLERLIATSGERQVELRAALPAIPGADEFDQDAAIRSLSEFGRMAVNEDALRDVLRDLSGEILQGRRAYARHRLTSMVDPVRLSADTLISVQRNVRASLARKSDKINAAFGDIVLEFPADLEAELNNILNRGRLRIREISEVSLEMSMAVAEVLLENGCVELAATPES